MLQIIDLVKERFDINMALDIFKTVVGLVYLYLEYHANKYMWIASVIMPCIGICLFFNKGLYADCGMNIYYLLIAVYGWWVWTRGGSHTKTKSTDERQVTHIGIGMAIGLLGVFALAWGLIAWLLMTFTDSTVPYLDSMTTAMSIVGMWMLARKYVEQWLVWIVVDAIYVYLYYYKGIYFSGSLYLFYMVTAVFGYRKWSRMAAATVK